MRNNNKNFYINRVRLINFHNFVNETIEIKNGGHLFLLGDNGSGKTTVLDAVHYVLTAGESMEFNSAARVAGTRDGGRRAQGFITRYNVDTGHMNPNGGVTYAALEISGRNGKVSTIAIGMSVGSPDENLKRWGIIRECPLEEIPFLVNGKNGVRPRNSAEMKRSLKSSGFYGKIGAYKSQIAERFTGGQAMFRDYCNFLSMGKAYREIVAHSSDYHALFKRLLPQPGADIFERIIESLKTLDSSRGDMENLRSKYEYVSRLNSMRGDIAELLQKSELYDAVAAQIKQTLAGQSLNVKREKLGQLTREEQELIDALATLKDREQQLSAELDDLKSQDASGILRQEQELRSRIRVLKNKFTQAEKTSDSVSDNIDELKKNVQKLDKKINVALKDALASLADFSSQLKFSSSELMASLEDVIHSKEPENKIDKIPFSQVLDKASSEQLRLNRQKHSCETTLENLLETEEELNMEIIALERSPEAEPEVRYFAEAVKEINNAVIDATPIYKGLEWKKNTDFYLRSAIEEFIGQQILGTILVAEEDYERAADIIYNEFPGIRIAKVGEKDKAPKEFLTWAGKIFDLKKSDAFCLYALSRELQADGFPEFQEYDNFTSVTFRGHSCSLIGYEPCLIGSEIRREAQAAKLKERQDELKGVSKDIKELQNEIKDSAKNLSLLNKFTSSFDTMLKNIQAVSRELSTSRITVKHKEELGKSEGRRSRELARELEDSENRLKQIQQIIKKQNLHELDKKISQLSTEMSSCREELEKVLSRKIRTEQQRERLATELQQEEELVASGEKALNSLMNKLHEKYKLEDPAGYIAKLRSEQRLRTVTDALTSAESFRSDAFRKQGLLRAEINNPAFAGIWAFYYDEETNNVFDRGNTSVNDIELRQRRHLEEQQTLINEKTSELFTKIIVTELVTYLKEKQSRLKEMVKSINRLLDGRMFGNNLYRFQISPVEKYNRLEQIIARYAFYDSASENDLRNFFEDHKEEIVATEAGEVPEILDYRNWYHYEMKVITPGSDGKVMDRHIKSIGSGGEQAVPNYLLILTIAHFLYHGSDIKLYTLLFDEAFYGIDAQRRDQLMGFASDLDLQLFVASPDQDGVKREIACSTSMLVVKDKNYDVHLFPFHWSNPEVERQGELFVENETAEPAVGFTRELDSA
jgi:DNA repair exonuclease SbcCD ATPase subunit